MLHVHRTYHPAVASTSIPNGHTVYTSASYYPCVHALVPHALSHARDTIWAHTQHPCMTLGTTHVMLLVHHTVCPAAASTSLPNHHMVYNGGSDHRGRHVLALKPLLAARDTNSVNAQHPFMTWGTIRLILHVHRTYRPTTASLSLPNGHTVHTSASYHSDINALAPHSLSDARDTVWARTLHPFILWGATLAMLHVHRTTTPQQLPRHSLVAILCATVLQTV